MFKFFLEKKHRSKFTFDRIRNDISNIEEKRQFIQVIVLPRESVDTIVFPISVLHGDTLIAAGEKNKARWGDHFELTAVASASGRPLLVKHGGKMAVLDRQNPDTVTFRGMANSGPWEIRSLMTDTEKKDPARTPPTLRLRTNLLGRHVIQPAPKCAKSSSG